MYIVIFIIMSINLKCLGNKHFSFFSHNTHVYILILYLYFILKYKYRILLYDSI